ncbi:helix-turn-helix domain-containing protein [Actinokineospora auranticolor]|uniref:DNA-binding PucR family transcriptional regulator n=1 Tax=Actinokineospora auranticolor TaxID=155976 RepID=A0A2S6GXD8_9PSEU|nr:PucR family transcriptional regulator [Actinokineospora auranticolor]PPK69905.1 DNA-binding PucR family transcriptional regulator [Actinokineospora auranticolor]
MITVQGVVDRMGPTLLRTVHADERAPLVGDVVIAESGKRTPVSSGDLVLGIAVQSTAEAVELVRQCGEQGAAAVLLKPPHAGRHAVKAVAGRVGTGLVEVRGATAWAQLVWLLRSVLDAAADEAANELNSGAGPFGDLFRLADAAAAVVDAPVTIEDANSRVLAYSARQDRTDPARVSTIMGRRVPDDVLARFRSRGVFRELSRGRTAIFVPAQKDGTLPRLIVPVRMGGELLGSMWAVVAGPVSDERAAAFADAAPVVALHLLRRRAREDSDRRRSAELVRSVLDGTGSARLGAAELDLSDDHHRVVAIDTQAAEKLAEGVRLALLERLSAGVGRRPAVADLHGLLYAIVPDTPGPGGWPELRTALTELAGPLVAAGTPVRVGELARSRAEADEALSLLRAGLVPGPLAVHDEVWTVLVLHRTAVASTGAGVAHVGPLTHLRARGDASWYLDTLYEWLRHPGDPRAAAAALSIHPNTLRYRMSRVTAALEVDLGDPDTRLALLTQLVALRWG